MVRKVEMYGSYATKMIGELGSQGNVVLQGMLRGNGTLWKEEERMIFLTMYGIKIQLLAR